MGETKEEQRQRLGRKRAAESSEPLIPCLECELKFKRVGSHVVQVHGYESVLEYRREHGLMARETRLESYAQEMRKKVSTVDNLEKGAGTRFVKGGDHPDKIKEFWKNRKRFNRPREQSL